MLAGYKILASLVLATVSLLGVWNFMSQSGNGTPWPHGPRLTLCVKEVLTDPDPLRRSAPSSVDKFGLPATYQSSVECADHVDAEHPFACLPPLNTSKACCHVEKFYFIYSAKPNFKPNSTNQKGVKGVPPAYLYNQSVRLPYMPMYDCDFDTRWGWWSPLLSFGLGKPETVLGNLHQAQLLPSNPSIRGLTVIPEYGSLDMTGASKPEIALDRVQTFNNSIKYAQRYFSQYFNPNWIIVGGHSDGGSSAIQLIVGNVLLGIREFAHYFSDLAIALYFSFDGAIFELVTQKGVDGTLDLGGYIHLNTPGIAFSSSYNIGYQDSTVLWGNNLNYTMNKLILPTNSTHMHYAPGQITALDVTTNLNTVWNNITYSSGYPSQNMQVANTTAVVGQTMLTYFTYMEAAAGGYLQGIGGYAEMLTHRAMCRNQGYSGGYCSQFQNDQIDQDDDQDTDEDGGQESTYRDENQTWATLLFQFWDKPGGCGYMTRRNEANLQIEEDHYYAPGYYTPKQWENYVLSYPSSAWSGVGNPNLLGCFNGLNTTGIFECTPAQWNAMSWTQANYVGPCAA